MSRIGKKPVPVPAGVTVNLAGSNVAVKGPKGELKFVLTDQVIIGDNSSLGLMHDSIVYALLSWIAPGTYSPATQLLDRLCEPLLRPFRRAIPPIPAPTTLWP